ncbi:MAG TPA: hypothetical protein VK956_08160, partial [Verrucomicrobium sp.]|nr:hypothetical protein [Verrucomicrobium sp.]
MKSIAVAIVIWGIALCAISHAINPPSILRNELIDPDGGQSQELGKDIAKLIVLVHGWNGDSGTMLNLKDAMTANITGSDWGLIQYNWFEDSHTGPVWEYPFGVQGFINASEAAVSAYQHGMDFANRILTDYPNVTHLHIIAYSAGAWFPLAATSQLMNGSNIMVQITLLDPFVPGREVHADIPDQVLTDGFMGMLKVLPEETLFLLENYYAPDPSDSFESIAPNATFGDFDWRSGDIQRNVRWQTFYGSHSGPMDFYRDTIDSANGSIRAGLLKPDSDFTEIGWKRSMYFLAPSFIRQPENSFLNLGSSASFTIEVVKGGDTLSSPSGLHLQWQEKPPRGSWRNRPEASSTLVVGPVTSEMNGTLYR